MTKLKLGPLVDDRPVKLAVELPAALAAETGQQPMPPEKLIAPMLARFMDTDRGFRRHRAQGS